MKTIIAAFSIFFLTTGIFIFTRNPVTGPYRLQLAFGMLILFFFFTFVVVSKKKLQTIAQRQRFMFLLSAVVLCFIGATNWFFSPFFYLLYLLIILLDFTFPIVISLVLSCTIILLLSFNICEVDCTYDGLTIISLLSTLPLSLFLKRIYRQQQEEEKEILVLRNQRKEYATKIDEILDNTVNYFSVTIKQPINNMKQLAYLIKGKSKDGAVTTHAERIIASSEEALRLLNKFETDATGAKILKTSVK